jgi:hypothetical protein
MDEQCMKPGVFSWCELITSDVTAAKNFYGQLFGWTTEDMNMPGMSYSVVSNAGQAIGGIMATPPEAAGVPPMWGAYVTVEDIDATAALAEQLGARLLVPPRDIPEVGRFCVIQDPQGAVINAISYLKR